MIWEQMGKPSSIYELHLANVYADQDFHTDLEKYIPNLKGLMHDFWTVGGEQGRAMKKQLKAASQNFPAIADKYCIAVSDIDFYATGQNLKGDIPKKDIGNEVIVNEDGKFTVYFDDTITKQDLLDLWDVVKQYKDEAYSGRTYKNKPLIYDQLVYAIFKAKTEAKVKGKKLTYLQIFTKYRADELKGYSQEKGHDRKIFNNYKSLEKYYRRNQPAPKTDTYPTL